MKWHIFTSKLWLSWFNCNSADSDLIILYPQLDHSHGFSLATQRPTQAITYACLYYLVWIENNQLIGLCASRALKLALPLFWLVIGHFCSISAFVFHIVGICMLQYLRKCWIILVYFHFHGIRCVKHENGCSLRILAIEFILKIHTIRMNYIIQINVTARSFLAS